MYTPRELVNAMLMLADQHQPHDMFIVEVIDPTNNQPVAIELSAAEFAGKCQRELIALGEIPDYYTARTSN